MAGFDFTFKKTQPKEANIGIIETKTDNSIILENSSLYTEYYSKTNYFIELKKDLENNQQKLEDKIKNNKLWLAKQPLKQDFIEKLQFFIHEKNIEVFSDMLSAFVGDVLEKDKKIELELYTSHNLPALKLYASQNGNPESLVDGSGGSLTNIVSTGLRIIACARNGGRKFMILDEADCWIRPERVPLFAKVVGEISLKLDMQILMISHHNSDYFKNYGRVIQLQKHANRLEAVIVSDTEFDKEKYKDKNYISCVKMQDFLSHEDTNIELHPNITCITGENDIGKSAITAFFKSVVRGDSEDSFIKHDTEAAKGYITFSDDTSIYWKRNKKLNQENKQKVFFQLFSKDNALDSAYSSYESPDFVNKVFNMPIIDNIDINISHQKDPMFLIDAKTKPQDKAKILSLGQESIIVQKMMEKLKDETKKIKNEIKTDEIIFHKNSLMLNALQNLDYLIEKVQKIKELNEKLAQSQQNLIESYYLIKEISNYSKVSNIDFFNKIISVHEINNTQELETLIYNIKKLNAISSIDNLNLIIIDNKFENQFIIEEDLNILIKNLLIYKNIDFKSLSKYNNLSFDEASILNNFSSIKELETLITKTKEIKKIQNIDFIEEIKANNLAEKFENNNSNLLDLSTLISEIKNSENNFVLLKKKEDSYKKDLEKLEKEKNTIFNKLGQMCPECGQKTNINDLFNLH